MELGRRITELSVKHPRLVTALMCLTALCLGSVAALPSLWPRTFHMLHPLKVDTDPENMLPEDESVRVFHNEMKRGMALHDMIVLGVVNEKHPNGVFNPESLRKVHELTEYAKGLRWEDEHGRGGQVGVIGADIIAPSTVDNIEQGGPGEVRFEWLMPSPPATDEEALAVRQRAQRIPFLDGTLVSDDGKALCLYLPLTSKDLSHRVYTELRKKIATFQGDEEYHITGLPVAEDTFGVEMFKQMAISAPLAMLIIFILMMLFFRKLILVVSPMIVAIVAVVCTMGLLVATGRTVHIMSSMIPIFIVPIAVLDAVHILSEFFDRYPENRDSRATVVAVMDTLYVPMFYTSLTTAVGFASLALTPIPPVQVFGLFVAFGVMVAWAATVTFIPAYVVLIPPRWLDNFGAAHGGKGADRASALGRLLAWTGGRTSRYARLLVAIALAATLVAVYGISRVQINDNPIKWFTRSHPIRVADKVLNEHFGGTYMAYLSLQAEEITEPPEQYARALADRAEQRGRELTQQMATADAVFAALAAEARRLAPTAQSKEELLKALRSLADEQLEADLPDEEYYAWDEAVDFLGAEAGRDEVFKQPEALTYIGLLQAQLAKTDVVGKSNSLADIVKTVHRELLSGEDEDARIPETAAAVAQCLMTFESGHRPQDLAHLVKTDDFRTSVIWVQLTSGDNKAMEKVERAVDEHIAANPPPFPIRHRWFGLTYINVVWQKKMVRGMLQAFMGSFLCVFLMMTVLYRSALWGILCMIPLAVTIALLYGVVGLTGKDYDMPVAVLSSLSLGLAVDYAIHFLSRSRALREQFGSWGEAAAPVFGEPARAIARNVIVVGVGFLPLVAAPLVPYKTVGVFIAAILLSAGVASLLILPALITLMEDMLFPSTKARAFACRCGTCIVSGLAAVALVVVNLLQFLRGAWAALTWVSAAAIIVLAATCVVVGRSAKCRAVDAATRKGETG